MDQENKVNKMFIMSLGNLTELESIPQSQAVCTLYRLLNQPMYVVPEGCNNWLFTYASVFPICMVDHAKSPKNVFSLTD